MLRVLLFLIALLLSVPATAQTVCTSNCSLFTAQAFSVVADDTQPAANVDGYRLYDNAVVIRDATTATVRAGSVVTFSFPTGVPSAGSHSYVIAAYNFSGEGKTPVLAATVIQAPAIPLAPTGIRIVR